MVEFIGTYKHEKDDNLEELFTKLGMNFFIRKLALHSKPTLKVSIEGDTWTLETIMSMRTLLWTFKLGEEAVTDGTDGPVKSVFTVEGEKLVQTPVDDKNEKALLSIRQFTPEGINQTLVHKASGTTAYRTFTRT